MRHRLLATLFVGAAFAFAVPAAAFAQDEELEEAGPAAKKKGDPDDRFCIKETGSRIVASRNRSKKSDEECVNAAGRVYTRKDIERTGSTDVKDALRRLDPSVF